MRRCTARRSELERGYHCPYDAILYHSLSPPRYLSRSVPPLINVYCLFSYPCLQSVRLGRKVRMCSLPSPSGGPLRAPVGRTGDHTREHVFILRGKATPAGPFLGSYIAPRRPFQNPGTCAGHQTHSLPPELLVASYTHTHTHISPMPVCRFYPTALLPPPFPQTPLRIPQPTSRSVGTFSPPVWKGLVTFPVMAHPLAAQSPPKYYSYLCKHLHSLASGVPAPLQVPSSPLVVTVYGEYGQRI